MSAGTDSGATGAPPTSPQGGLTPGQIARFEEDGFLILRHRVPAAALQALIDELSRRVDQGVREAVSEGLLDPSQTFEEGSFANRLTLVSRACADPGWIWERHFREQKPRSAGLFRLRAEPALLDVVESLIGPEILAHPQYAVRTKMPDQEITVIPWHQDLAYLIPEEAGQTLVVNLWIPLVDATVANGCMQLVRGSHRLGLLPHNHRETTPGHKGSRGISPGDLPEGAVVDAEVAVGDVLLTTERLVHRSLPNTTDTVRWSVDSRYNQLGLPTGRDGTPGFVARSRRHPEQVARGVDDWNRIFAQGGTG